MRSTLLAMVMTLTAGCRCGESTPPVLPKATEAQLVEAATKALCETALAQDMAPLVKAPDSVETTDQWRRVFFTYEEQLHPFGDGAHFANDAEAKKRIVDQTAATVWKTCPSHVSARWNQDNHEEVERLIHHALANKWPRK